MEILITIKRIALAIAVVMFVSCDEVQDQSKATKNSFSDEFMSDVETCAVGFVELTKELKLTGKVEYDPDKIVRYMSLAGGVVESTNFNVGDRVQKAQAMAVIQSAELSAMQAEKQNLEAEIEVRKRELESVQKMYDDRLASQKELIEARNSLKQSEIEAEKVRLNLSLYGSSGNDGKFVIRAPITGFVIEKNIASGAQIAAEGDPLFTVADLSSVWIMVNVYAGDLAFVKQGMPVDIRTLSWKDEVFSGTIDAVSQVFSAEEHVLKARIVMPNAQMKFRPEMAVDLTLKANDGVKMATAPAGAVLFDRNKYFVVIKRGTDFVCREIVLESRSNDMVYVASGIDEGDSLVVKNPLLIYSKLLGR